MSGTPTKVRSLPGIKRDGTVLEGDHYIDGQWCRFQRGLPRKMGGYQMVTDTVPEIIRGMTSFSATGLRYLHAAGANGVFQYVVTGSGTLSSEAARTPVGFVGNVNNMWQFDHFYDSTAVVTDVIAHGAQNLTDIDSTVNSLIYLGPATASTPLVDSGLPAVSGGILTVGPYLFSFGNNGRIGWSAVNDPTMLSSEGFVTQQKVVCGKQLRGTGTGPAALFWSLDAVIRATFGDPLGVEWHFDTIAGESSILSSQGVVEYDGVYYWPGVDRWLLFNGVIRDIPNTQNINYFFDGLNFAHRQKVFGFKIPRFGEIWWCYPRGNATECSHAVIYNVREGYWYDTALPSSFRQVGNIPGRTSGVYAKVYNKPFMFDADIDPVSSTYSLWQHETGVDQISGPDIEPIPSWFETGELGMPVSEEPSNFELRVGRMEPDFVQAGALSLYVRGRANSKAPYVESGPFNIPETASQPTDETVKLKEIRRLMSFKFESNTQGGDYEFGETLAHIEQASERIES